MSNINDSVLRVGDTAHLRCESLIVSMQQPAPEQKTAPVSIQQPAQSMDEVAPVSTNHADGQKQPISSATHPLGKKPKPAVVMQRQDYGAGQRIIVHRFNSQALSASTVLHIGSIGTVDCRSATYSNTN